MRGNAHVKRIFRKGVVVPKKKERIKVGGGGPTKQPLRKLETQWKERSGIEGGAEGIR